MSGPRAAANSFCGAEPFNWSQQKQEETLFTKKKNTSASHSADPDPDSPQSRLSLTLLQNPSQARLVESFTCSLKDLLSRRLPAEVSDILHLSVVTSSLWDKQNLLDRFGPHETCPGMKTVWTSEWRKVIKTRQRSCSPTNICGWESHLLICCWEGQVVAQEEERILGKWVHLTLMTRQIVKKEDQRKSSGLK